MLCCAKQHFTMKCCLVQCCVMSHNLRCYLVLSLLLCIDCNWWRRCSRPLINNKDFLVVFLYIHFKSIFTSISSFYLLCTFVCFLRCRSNFSSEVHDQSRAGLRHDKKTKCERGEAVEEYSRGREGRWLHSADLLALLPPLPTQHRIWAQPCTLQLWA